MYCREPPYARVVVETEWADLAHHVCKVDLRVDVCSPATLFWASSSREAVDTFVYITQFSIGLSSGKRNSLGKESQILTQNLFQAAMRPQGPQTTSHSTHDLRKYAPYKMGPLGVGRSQFSEWDTWLVRKFSPEDIGSNETRSSRIKRYFYGCEEYVMKSFT
ncbi:hypothetical protein VNO77_04160 [Canavalia gladiata]|uniref:Uncharacterized protein n=1 Tax=Canavalia gladiata TaxID=3824 RepID=A0AAN9R4K3_CANGL